MNNGHRALGLRSVCLYVRHNVMAHLSFITFGSLVIDVVGIFFQFGDLFGRNIQPEFHFRFSQRNPKFSPKFEPLFIGKRMLHFLACISRTKRILVNRIIRHGFSRNFHSTILYRNCFSRYNKVWSGIRKFFQITLFRVEDILPRKFPLSRFLFSALRRGGRSNPFSPKQFHLPSPFLRSLFRMPHTLRRDNPRRHA